VHLQVQVLLELGSLAGLELGMLVGLELGMLVGLELGILVDFDIVVGLVPGMLVERDIPVHLVAVRKQPSRLLVFDDAAADYKRCLPSRVDEPSRLPVRSNLGTM
jgi:hypothetical protein